MYFYVESGEFEKHLCLTIETFSKSEACKWSCLENCVQKQLVQSLSELLTTVNTINQDKAIEKKKNNNKINTLLIYFIETYLFPLVFLPGKRS